MLTQVADAIQQRIYNVMNQNIRQNSGHASLNERISAVLARLQDVLPESEQHILTELDALTAESETLAIEIAYRTGMVDGMRIGGIGL